MDRKRAKALEAEGWRIGGTVQELLQMSDEEALFVEIRIELVRALRERRKKQKKTQAELAELLGSSQPRVAALERGEGTLDLVIRGLLALGATPRVIGRTVARATLDH